MVKKTNGDHVRKNVKVLLRGTVLELDPVQDYQIRVQLEDGSPVWVRRDMLIPDRLRLPDVPEHVIHDAYELRKYADGFNATAVGNFFNENGVLKMSDETRAWFNQSAENRMKFFKILGSD